VFNVWLSGAAGGAPEADNPHREQQDGMSTTLAETWQSFRRPRKEAERSWKG